MRWNVLATALIVSLSLSGCSAFVPSWNAQPTPIEIDNEAEPEEVSEVEPETEPEPVDPEPETEPEPVETEPVERSEVNVEIAQVYTDNATFEVIAQVLDVVEDGGECTLKFLAGDFSTEATVLAERSSNYTQCAPIDIPLPTLPSGTAAFSVEYISDSYEGESEPDSVVIP